MVGIFRQTLESTNPSFGNVQNSGHSSILMDTPEGSAESNTLGAIAGSTICQDSDETDTAPDEEQNSIISIQGQYSTVASCDKPSLSSNLRGDNDELETGNTAPSSTASRLSGVSSLSISGSIGHPHPPSSSKTASQVIRYDLDLSGSDLWPAHDGLREQQDFMDPVFDMGVEAFDPNPSFFSQDIECQVETLGMPANSHSFSFGDDDTYLTHDTMVELLHFENQDPRAMAAWKAKHDGNKYLQSW
jgi:hypothetical protein